MNFSTQPLPTGATHCKRGHLFRADRPAGKRDRCLICKQYATLKYELGVLEWKGREANWYRLRKFWTDRGEDPEVMMSEADKKLSQ